MGYGLGMALKGWNQGVEDQRRRKREDDNQAWRKESRDYVREDRGIQAEERDYQKGLRPLRERSMKAGTEAAEIGADQSRFGLERMRTKAPQEDAAIARKAELDQILLDMKKSEQAIYNEFLGAKTDNEKMRIQGDRVQLEETLYGQAYQRFKMGDSRGAAMIINEMAGNGIKNAADVRDLGDGQLAVVDENGNPVVSPDSGNPMVFDQAQLEIKYGAKPTNDRYSMSDGVVLDKRTGTTASAVGGNKGSEKASDVEKELRRLSSSAWGSLSGDQFVFDGRNASYAAANQRRAYEIYRAMPPSERSVSRAHELALAEVQAMAREDDKGTPEQRAEQEIRDEMGMWDYVPFNEPDQSAIEDRAAKMRAERAGMAGQGVPAKKVETGVDWGSRTFKNMQWKSKSGKVITMDKILATAKNRGKTPEQVMEDIGIDHKSLAAKAQ